jgi:PAS domain S-box-containing protein
MPDFVLAEKIVAMRNRLEELREPAVPTPPHVSEALEELQVSLEELHVAQEELEERTAALATERQRYWELFDFTPGGCAVTDAEGVIREANRAMAALLHVPQDRLIGKPIGLYVSDADKHTFRTWLTSFERFSSGAGQATDGAVSRATKEIQFQPRNGSPFPVSVTLAPTRGADGRLKGFRWLCVNIADRKHAETERRLLEGKLLDKERLDSLAMLAGGVAHDFNNLLTSVLGHADLLVPQLADTSPAHVHVDAIIVAARRAADLSSQLLAFSGKGKFVAEPVRLQTFLLEMQPLLEALIASRCRIEYDLSPAAVIEADLTQLRQIVMNLVLNAVEASVGPGGTVRLRVSTLVCERSRLAKLLLGEDLPEGSYAVIEVADAGCGMTPETQARMFEPFFSTKHSGRGFGLAAVFGIVRSHRGALDVETAPGQGATVRVFFPTTDRPTTAPAPPLPTTIPVCGSGTVLVVDDDPSIRTLARSVLESAGFTVWTAADGVDALDVFRRHTADIRAVLLDLTMPRMGGAEVLRHLRTLSTDLPVILTSGFTDSECLGPLGEDRHARFLPKPYRRTELLAAFQAALEGKASRPA